MKNKNIIFNMPHIGILESKPIEGIDGMLRLEFDAKGQFIIEENTCEKIGHDYLIYYEMYVKPYLIEHITNYKEIFSIGTASQFDIILDILSDHEEVIFKRIKKLLLEDYEANFLS